MSRIIEIAEQIEQKRCTRDQAVQAVEQATAMVERCNQDILCLHRELLIEAGVSASADHKEH